VTWRRQLVKRGDTIAKLAKQYGTSTVAIQQANRMGASKALRPGSFLLIPVVAADEPGPRARKYIAAAAKTHVSDGDSSRRVTYVVKRGDTLAAISRRHKVSVTQIMRWNRKHSRHILVGERLRIFVAAD
jgi:LysM repeat protein